MASLAQSLLVGKEEFLRVHVPELLTAEGKKYYAYLDFPEKQVDLLTFWQRCVHKAFFFCARSAVLGYQLLFDVLSVDGFQPCILAMVVGEMALKGELGVVSGGGFARLLLEKNSFPQAKRQLREAAREAELDVDTQIVSYEFLETKLRTTEAHLAELFRARPFLTDAEIRQAVRGASAADDAEVEILRALLLVATPIRVHQEHFFNSASFGSEEEVSRQFMLFELGRAVAEGEAALAQPPKPFSKGDISVLLDGGDQAEAAPTGEARRQLAYNRILRDFVASHRAWGEIAEFRRNTDYVKLKAASVAPGPASTQPFLA